MVSIVSAYYKNEDMTVDFLENLKDKVEGCEVILVNAGSTPIDHDLIRRIDLEKNKSFANSMNAGIKASKGDFVCVIGNDVFPDKGWIEKLVETAEKSGAMITAPLNSESKLDNYATKEAGSYYTIPSPHMFPAVCWLMSRECIDKVGLFDERFEIGCYEDNDYCKRVHQVNGKIVVEPSVVVKHLVSKTINFFDVQKAMQTNYQKFHDKWT